MPWYSLCTGETNPALDHGHVFSLKLDHNRLTKIPDLSHLHNILTLYLSSNSISNSPNDKDLLALDLTHLYLDHDALTSIPAVSDLPQLTELHVSHNHITSIDGIVLPNSLSTLDADANNITAITTTLTFTFNDLPNNLFDVYLSDNPITSIATDAFQSLNQLRELDLTGTRLTRLPVTLADLTNLDILYLYDIPDLVCTCQESLSLVGWYNTRPASMVLDGDCGETSVQYFLGNLAQKCPTS